MSRVRVVSLCICHQRGILNESLPSRNLNYHAVPHISGAVKESGPPTIPTEPQSKTSWYRGKFFDNGTS